MRAGTQEAPLIPHDASSCQRDILSMILKVMEDRQAPNSDVLKRRVLHLVTDELVIERKQGKRKQMMLRAHCGGRAVGIYH